MLCGSSNPCCSVSFALCTCWAPSLSPYWSYARCLWCAAAAWLKVFFSLAIPSPCWIQACPIVLLTWWWCSVHCLAPWGLWQREVCPASVWIPGLAMENCEEEQLRDSCTPCARLERSVFPWWGMLLDSLKHLNAAFVFKADDICVKDAADIYFVSVDYIPSSFNNSSRLIMDQDSSCFEDIGLSPFL